MSDPKTKKTKTIEALCPYCNHDISPLLLAKIKAGTHTYGTVEYCPKCQSPTAWVFNWEMVLHNFSVAPKVDKDDKSF